MLAQRQLIEHYLADEQSRQKYQTPAGKLGVLSALLAARVFKAEQTYQLQFAACRLARATRAQIVGDEGEKYPLLPGARGSRV